jgi:glycosyl transferase, family 25
MQDMSRRSAFAASLFELYFDRPPRRLRADLKERHATMGILDYFDRLAIIHLPDREDRFRALRRELARIGIDIHDPKVTIPDPPMPPTANGFTSKGVYGSFLSHLEIIEQAYADGLDSVWVLEDDAIFNRRFNRCQRQVAQDLRTYPWDMCFIGHTTSPDVPYSPTGLLRYSGPFIWAHAYGVHRRIMPRLIEYLHETMERPIGDPLGGKLYIDAAYFFFRQFNADVISVVSSPCFSVQKGSRSSLASRRWFERFPLAVALWTVGRAVRDEFWRQGFLRIDGPQIEKTDRIKVKDTPPTVWPQSPPIPDQERSTP